MPDIKMPIDEVMVIDNTKFDADEIMDQIEEKDMEKL